MGLYQIQLGSFVPKTVRDNNSVDVQVVCRVTDSKVLLGAETETFTNRVTLKKDGKEVGTAKSPVSIEISEENKDINKKQVKGNGQKIDFEINANQLGQKLPLNDNDKLKLVDELGENLQLDTTSIKVYKNGNEEIKDCETSYQNNILEITVPNDVPIKITYTVIVNAKPNDPVKISNTAYWKGYSKDSGKTVEKSYSYTVGGGIEAFTKVNFKLTKQDQNNLNVVLQGAKFDIEKCVLNKNNEIVSTEKVNKTTGSNGTIGDYLEFDTLYKITETKAPDGYVIDNKPIYILDLKDKEQDTSFVTNIKNSIKDGELIVRYKEKDFGLQITNHKGEITVVKKFINDAAGNSHNPVSGTYTFGLYEDSEGKGDPIQTKTITYKAGETKEKSVKFINLDLNKTYYVFELDDEKNPITDSSKEATVNKLVYTVEYSTNGVTNGGTVTVTNKSHTKLLPSTGSIGTLVFRLSGATLAFAGMISLSQINKKRKRK